ncbi:hypothetical protein K525DRAFT_214716 [Schizophyllum commune Loenen D]|nr:hypothetical protein K525DRAFT_214716 [Schizophyllum commune Loenen D]
MATESSESVSDLEYVPYTTYEVLSGPADAINILAFSPDGRYLAATGYEGAFVWDLGAMAVDGPIAPVPTPPQAPGSSCIWTAAAWVHLKFSKRELLLLGSLSGEVTIWFLDYELRIDPKVPQECDTLVSGIQIDDRHTDVDRQIVSLAANRDTLSQQGQDFRIACATMNGTVVVLQVSAQGEPYVLCRIDNSAPESFRPRSLAFAASADELFTFSLGGVFKKYDMSGHNIWTKEEGPKFMVSVVLLDDHRCVAQTGNNLSLVSLDDASILQEYKVGPKVIQYPKGVAIAEGGTLVVCTVLQELPYHDPYNGGLLVQPVAACMSNGRPVVATAGSTREEASHVHIWRKDLDSVDGQDGDESLAQRDRDGLRGIAHKAVGIACGCLFVWLFPWPDCILEPLTRYAVY